MSEIVIGEATTGEPSLLPMRERPWLKPLIAAFAVAVSGVVSTALVLRLPRQLAVSTDIVGYPIFANYNVDRLKSIYYIGILFFPIVALAIYLGLTWIVSRRRNDKPWANRPDLHSPASSEDRSASRTAIWAADWAHVLAVGLAFGLGASFAIDAVGGAFWVTLAAAAVAYGGLVVVVSRLLMRAASVQRTMPATMSLVNVVAAPLTVASLGVASASTWIRVVSDGSVHRYSWLPGWAAIALTAAVLGWVCYRLSRAKGEAAVRDLERRVILFVASPVSLFLLLSRMPGALGPMDMFHDGEALVAARLTMAGYFPWRDLMSIHGFFQDALVPLVGMQLFENSRWGAEAGRAILLDPLAFVFLFAFIAWLFKRSWLLVVAFMALTVGGKLLPIVGSRFMFLPLFLLLLAGALERRTWWLGVALGCGLAVQAIFVPETAFAIVSCGLIVILHDYFHRKPGARLVDAFSLTAWCAAGGTAVFVVFGLVLLSQHAVSDYLLYFSLFASNRGLAGGAPLDVLSLRDRTYIFFAFSTPLALLIAFAYFATKVIRRRRLDTADWVIGAVAIFSVLYCEKFLERADLAHAEQVYAEAVPLFAFLGYRACTFVDAGLARWRSGPRAVSVLGWQPAAMAVLLIAVLAYPGVLSARLAATADRLHTAVASSPQISQIGYLNAESGIDPATYADLGMVLKAYLRPGDWVFDFSNEPGLYYYLLGQNPHTRYYHVSMAIPQVGQQDLISQLQRNQPKLVVFTNDRYGLPQWDGIPNAVRHYDVSQYILDHYTPLLSTHTQILYGLTSANLSPGTASILPLTEPVVIDDLAFRGYPCDWGDAPNFLSISSSAPARATAPVTLATAVGTVGFANVRGWAVDMEAGAPDSRVVVVANGEVVGEGTPSIDRPDVAQFVGHPAALRNGFSISAAIPTRFLSNSGGGPFIRVFGISASGVASELGLGRGAHNGKSTANNPPVSTLRLASGVVVPVRSGASIGIIDWIDAPRYQLQLSPSPGTAWTDYHWLEIDSRVGFREDRWSITDPGGDSGHEITFGTLDRSPVRYRVHVGSCAQWHGYASAQLLLSYGRVQDITAVRLLP